MMNSKKTWGLFLLPLLVPLALWIMQTIRKPQTLQGGVGVVTSNLQGEQLALHTLSYQLYNVPFDIVNIDWIVASPIKGRPFPIRTVITYDRRSQRFTEWIMGRSKQPNGPDTEVSYHFGNVTEEAIHQVASSQGVVKDLLKHGALFISRKER